MGVSVSFIAATAEELERAEKDPEWAEEFLSPPHTTQLPSRSTDLPTPARAIRNGLVVLSGDVGDRRHAFQGA